MTEHLPQASLADLTEDPYATYAEWRAASPILFSGGGQYLVTRYSDVALLLRDPRLLHAAPRPVLEAIWGDGPTTRMREHNLLNRDGSDHARLRALMGHVFSPSLVRAMSDRVAELADESLEPITDDIPFDLVETVAFPVPVRMISDMLGLRDVNLSELRGWATDLLSSDPAASDPAVAALAALVEVELARTEPDPEGNVLQRMRAAETGSEVLSQEEIVDNALFLFFAGFDTTRSLITSTVKVLLDHPAELAKVRAAPDLAASAVEEVLRYESPVREIPHFVGSEVDVGGHVVKPGRVLRLLLACANRDRDVFTDPDRLDVERSPNPHVAFGAGLHHCLGAMLARVEATVVLTRILARFDHIELASQPRRHVGAVGHWVDLPIRGRRAPA